MTVESLSKEMPVHSSVPGSSGGGWIDKLGAIGAVVMPLAFIFSFFTAGDTGDTAAELISYAKDNEGEVWLLQVLALLTPLLIGSFLASLWSRLRGTDETLRGLVLAGGTLFVAFVSSGLTLWAAPLLSADELTTAGAEAYLTFDDVGWVLLALGGISIGAMIIASTLAARAHGWLPNWASWVSLALGAVALATFVAVGIFAWVIWLIAAGLFLLLGRECFAPAAEASSPEG